MSATHPDTRTLLTDLYHAAVRAALPAIILAKHLPPQPKGRFVVFAIGKAAAAMASAAEAHYADATLEGIALTRHGHGQALRHITLTEAGHPMPDAAGMDASARIMAMAESLTKDDFALVLMSGGGSALTTLPIEGVGLADKQALTKALLTSGAPIQDINTVRKHLSRFKGGRLASAIAPARSLTLAISDVAGDEPATIASGPTVPDPTTKAEAFAILERWRIDLPPHIRAAMEAAPESPKPGDKDFDLTTFRLIANGAASLEAAAAQATTAGYDILNLGDRVEGEARDVARSHAKLALAAKRDDRRLAILSGGETSVTLGESTSGNGGPNQEYALALAIALDGAKGISALAGDTDGIDGGAGDPHDPAGALIFADTLARAEALGLNPQAALEAHDSGSFFKAMDDLLNTGPTFTNVNDFRVILIE